MADTLNSINQQAKLAVLLPVACAIGASGEIARLKKEILKENTLDAVFTLPFSALKYIAKMVYSIEAGTAQIHN